MSSIKERLAAARQTALRTHSVSIPIPGYRDDALVACYRTPDFDVIRDWSNAKIQGAPSAEEIEAIADGLVKANIGMEAHFDGSVEKLPHKLGAALTDYLGIEGASEGTDPDRTAVFLLIPDTIELWSHWLELLTRSRQEREKVRDEVVGESHAS